ncbi:hypothetical protein CUMW_015250 [Citrus unshiu]|nr:hypothetical protein CUMW_015250 [Citrus unshiu]
MVVMITILPKKTQITLIILFLLTFHLQLLQAQGKCNTGCQLALASYYVWEGSNLTYISNIFGEEIAQILLYNPNIPNQNTILSDTRISIPFSCDCLNGDFLGHTFTYETQFGDTYEKVASFAFANLTTEDWVRRVNIYEPTRIPDYAFINVTVNCSCGDRHISRDYGFFTTYPLRPAQNLSSVAAEAGVAPQPLQRYNPGTNFSAGTGLVFVPARGISSRAIAGISIGGVAGALFLAFCVYAGVYRRKKVVEASFLPEASEDHYIQHGPAIALVKNSESAALVAAPRVTGITVDKSVEFSYEELAKATNDFSMANKIGQGGFGAVFYAELRGEKAAIKKMDMQASKEFLAELKVLTHVHHLNLVRLIGYCVEGSLFLVYEYIENGNLNQHLRGSGKDTLTWSARMQIALDSARGLEYIHEHTVPVYIHRDIKPANILIDKNFRAKVADFGLAKLTEVGSASVHTRLVGTFGYMPPEYAQYGEVSPKIDVYAFGVVLYELISAMEAVVKTNETITESTGLVALFEEVLRQPDPREDLQRLVDPRLGDDYPIDSVRKMARLARACTQENPQLRPSMRAIVVALMTLSSSTEDWDIGSFYENQVLVPIFLWINRAESKCSKSCDSFASYNVWNGTNMTFISEMFDTSIDNILSFNPQVPDKDILSVGSRIKVPFKCNCINVSKDYGLFLTYPIELGENLSTVANMSGLSPQLLQSYNRGSDFSSGLVFIPEKDQSGKYPPLQLSRDGMSRAVLAGVVVGPVAGVLFLAFFLYTGFCKKKKKGKDSFLPEATENHRALGPVSTSGKSRTSESVALVASPGLATISVDKSVEFSYEELARATNDFSMANKIGQGGFGAVYYAELRDEKAAIKKMDMQASKEFRAELKVLTHVHHLNLVRLIGYCFEGSLCVVYEFIENGNLSQHLRGSGRDPLAWSTRLQIALDSARGLEYIHEHTVPVYIHRDIKSANILIDKNFRAKVADFGLTKLTEFGNASFYTSGLRGTFGYLPPEAVSGNVSPKTDVFAFGVVLYELISAKQAIVTTNETITQSKGLVALFEEVLRQPAPRENLHKLVDPRLGDNCPLDSVIKMAQLARACTEEDPQLRPSMRKVVVALTTLSSSTEDWDIGSLYENPTLVNLMSGR